MPKLVMAFQDNSKPPSGRLLALALLPLLTLILGWQLGSNFQEQRQLQEEISQETGSGDLTDPATQVNLNLLWKVWDLLLDNYIDPSALNTDKMLYGAISGLVEGIGDPYSMFMTPKENTDFRESLDGILQGIGAELMQREGAIVIVAPLRGSPAEKAGLQPGDIILSVNGESPGNSLTDAVKKIRGPKGSQVILLIAREGTPEPFEVTITRDEITVPSVESAIRETDEGSVLVITVNQFGDQTVTEVESMLNDYDDGNLLGIIIDVRYNGGGYLDRAVELVSLFLAEGKVVSVERRDGDAVEHFASGRPVDTDTPIVVLINEGTASASEIFAGALQDHDRATIIGKQSFGKGTVQEIYDLQDGASVRITVAHWITPGGRNLSKEGVTPDIEVERAPDDAEEGADPQMDAAIKYLLDL
ncbi:MAG TPA: S41 family peptidase [Candidatus Peribacteraceae bacterium]|nr:S41 family peptidase [Candidatus Peribacteraceae bacterium]